MRQSSATSGSFAARALTCIRNDVVLFENLAFSLEQGEILQIQGPNGSGKTSLLRILCGLGTPDAGEVLWQGADIRDHHQDYCKALSYVGHVNGVKLELTALENLVITRALAVAGNGITLPSVLEKVGLAEYETIPARKLSSGQRRRLALARLLMADTRVWILDEPFTALDDDGKQMIQDMLAGHIGHGGIAVLATHEPVDRQHGRVTTINL